MKARLLITMLVVVGMLPVATAQVAPLNSPDASTVGTSATVLQEGASNYTKLYVDSDHGHLELKPGESEEFTVTVKNGEDSEVTLNPHLYVSPVREEALNESWVSIDAEDTTLDAGEEREFAVTVSVPDDAKLGRYNGEVAFTDETVTYPGRPPRPVHSQGIYVEVWRQPTVQILSSGYMHSQVEAGSSVTHQIVIENTGDEAVPLSPELNTDRRRHYAGQSTTMKRSWFDIDAPSDIAPGETETVTVTVSAPENADRGRYNAQLDLGLKDPARDDRNTYWQQIDLNVQVWKQPADPFTTSFEVSEETNDVTLDLSSRAPNYYGAAAESKPVSFDVEFVNPDGETIEAKRVSVTDTGFVDLGSERRQTASDGEYSVRGGQETFTYRVDDPDAGTWSVRVMPHNAIGFGYEIVRNESDN